MYRRKIMDELVAWKSNTGKKKALVIKGMRQIGKTYIVQAFAKENKKFTYSQLEKKGRSENYQSAIQWLYDAGIINICYNLSNISLPLEGNKIDNIFKIYMQDSGLEGEKLSLPSYMAFLLDR